mgnify:FL=1
MYLDTTVNSLYSICQFYSQFRSTVQNHIVKSRATVEKELKNFVKISRWNDMNYWSVRASVDKAHKTLSKHMKVYHVSMWHRLNNNSCKVYVGADKCAVVQLFFVECLFRKFMVQFNLSDTMRIALLIYYATWHLSRCFALDCRIFWWLQLVNFSPRILLKFLRSLNHKINVRLMG